MAKSATSLFSISVFHCCFLLSLSQAKDTLKPGEDLRGAKTLVSSNGVFELGFFNSSSSSSSNHYLGIWFKNDPNKKPVWVANRENPILDSSGILSIRYDGNLVIVDRRQIPIIVNSGMLATATNTSSTLLDSEQFLVSWQSLSVPATGSFALGLDSNNRTQLKVWHRNGVSRQIAFWDGQRLKFMIESSSEDYNFSFVSKPDEVYITFNTRENYTSSWFVMSSTGQIQEYKMLGQKISMVNRSICENTTVSDATDCYIVRPSLCQDGDKFSEIKGSMPNSIVISDSAHLGLSDCEILCRGNCSCTAFAPFRDDGTGCEFYYGDKRALLGIIGVGKSIIYVRGDILPKPGDTGGKGNEDNTRRSLERFLFQIGSNVAALDEDKPEDRYNQKQDHELPLLSFSCMATATKNFSYENKLGEGGFGPVYKGVLLGHEIAVKRLSKQSGQGLEEFKNEVQLISKLQHRNLVRLLGCCIENEEKILIYEYMVNNSLDSFLFDPTKKILLDWKNRVFIIEGIAQGLLYLHKYSRFRIIHRDLKTSNILLDPHMNPKISDFGMARIFGEDEVRAKTNRVVGTYGYMSPEYVVHGHFSTKSDVFSFGVIILEIISGRKNVNFCHSDRSLNLLGYAWDLWKEGKGSELMDPTLSNSCSISQFMLCIQIGLLCVQAHPGDRPTMSDVISMLSNDITNLPAPKEPAFSTHTISYSNLHSPQYTLNDATFSDIEAR
ncbi:hypothetical protein ACJW31_01G301000 [Castanea mollissima]